MAEIAKAQRTSEAFVRTRATLAFLAPRLQAAILAGTQAPDLTLERLVREGVALDWAEQEQSLGVAAAEAGASALRLDHLSQPSRSLWPDAGDQSGGGGLLASAPPCSGRRRR